MPGLDIESAQAESRIKLTQIGSCPLLTQCALPLGTGPPGPPGGVVVRDIGDTTVQLSWSRGFDNHSPIAKYTLQARTPPSGKWKQVRTSKYEAPRGEGGWRLQPWSVPLKPLRIVARECSHAQHVWGEGHTALAKALWHQSSLAFQRVIEGLAYDWTRMRIENLPSS